ncbi:MAG: hypothetical protein U0903_06390 [Planctomycetales bacterium]
MQQILEKVALLARESHTHLHRFEPILSEDWNSEKCLYRLQAQGDFQEVSRLCDSLELTPLFEVEGLTLHGDQNDKSRGIGVEILLQVLAERCMPVEAASGSDSSC